ncbi:hypothetical protein SAMN05192553_104374 [Cyclobacterium xiamenense]|jgi:molybdenum cofactor biosynthesis enzyme MoaA|uniref:Uncharacterized protein n=1 Tax=Cyclobacterium xiamenense TaxID=1297121 RepID=A0A1H6ZQ46_9BACT|nr:hypothetical protein [Cyclobacterium xiamenense]SEJ50935.1 hypothetical protein SAMN05192553_104374 [Cyclobacterium xiamenense]
METLILNSTSEDDLKLLLDIAKKLGMDLRVADKQELMMTQAKWLNKSVQKNNISLAEIVESCSSVRKSRYEERKKDNP